MSTLSYRPTSNGTGGNIAFSIDSFSESEIEVYVDGVKRTNGGSGTFDYNINSYSATGGTIAWVGTAPTSSNKVRIQRRTRVLNNAGNAVEGKATYSAGAAVKATDLNNNTKQALRAIQEKQDQLVQTYDIQADAITNAKIADSQIDSEHYVDGSIDREHLAADIVDGTKIADNSINSEHYVDGSIDEEHIANTAVTANKIADGTVGTLELANGAVTTIKLGPDAVDGTKLADNAVDSEHYTDGSIDTVHIGDLQITANKIATDAVTAGKIQTAAVTTNKIEDDAVTIDKIAVDAVGPSQLATNSVVTNKIANDAVTIDKIADDAIVTNSEQASHSVNDTTFFTTAAAEARYFNVSTGETIKDGDTFPDNDTTIATTAAINDRIIDIVNDVGGFDIIESEQHFPNTNPQGQAGSAAVLSIKAASTNLVPSGTTVTITNGNLANNANITITGVTSTIPSGFGFIVESTSTLHTYTFHRLVPNATEVTTVAGKATEISRLGTAAAVEDMSILGTTDVVADMAILGTTDVVADMNTLATSDIVSDMNTLAVSSVLSDMSIVADAATNVNNVGNNITNVNSVSSSAGANQTFIVTVVNTAQGNKFYIDGVLKPVLKLARGKTYTFNQSDVSNSGHPLAFKDSVDASYTTGVTTSGTAGNTGATVVIAVAANAPSSLRYYCTSHGNGMGNTITVIDDNIGTVAGSITNVNTVGNAITNVNNVGNDISNVNTVASNISSVNSFFNLYRIGSSNPTSSLDTGDLFFNTSTNSLKVYTGSAWVDGVTTTGDFALKTGNTFTGSNIHNDSVKSIYGTNSDGLEIYHNGTHSYVVDSGTGELRLGTNTGVRVTKHDSETLANFKPDDAAELYYDNSKKLETKSDGIDVTGEVQCDSLDVDGGFNIDGSQITYDASSNIMKFTDSAELRFGSGNDLRIYHDGSHSYVNAAGTGALKLLGNNNDDVQIQPRSGYNSARFKPNNAVELYYDNSKKFETTSAGATVTGSLGIGTTSPQRSLQVGAYGSSNGEIAVASATTGYGSILFGDSTSGADLYRGYLQYHHSTDKMLIATNAGARITILSDGKTGINNSSPTESLDVTGNIAVSGTVDGVDIAALNTTVSNITTDLVTDTSPQLGGDLDTNSHHILLDDDHKLKVGDSSDLEIYHSGSFNFLVNNNSKNLAIQAKSGENALVTVPDGEVNLYYDHSKKFETTSTGASVSGALSVSNGISLPDLKALKLGDGDDLQISHTGFASYINNNSGDLYIRNDNNNDNANILIQAKDGENSIYIHDDGAVELYYDGNKKFETVSNGNKAHGHYFSDDGNRIQLGTSQDFQISHESNENVINCANSHNLEFRNGSERLAEFGPNGAVDLYYDNSIRLATTASGVQFHGDTFMNDGEYAHFGNSNDMFIGHSGTYSLIEEVYGDLRIHSNSVRLSSYTGGEKFFDATVNGDVELYYDNNNKLKTVANGVQVNGYLEGMSGDHLTFNTASAHDIRFRTNGTLRFSLNASGHLIPYANNTYDIGSSSNRFRNIYTNDLHLSNQGSSNDVDGTWGDWTMQEGESDLFLKNNRSGKKYKLNLTEVS